MCSKFRFFETVCAYVQACMRALVGSALVCAMLLIQLTYIYEVYIFVHVTYLLQCRSQLLLELLTICCIRNEKKNSQVFRRTAMLSSRFSVFWLRRSGRLIPNFNRFLQNAFSFKWKLPIKVAMNSMHYADVHSLSAAHRLIKSETISRVI